MTDLKLLYYKYIDDLKIFKKTSFAQYSSVQGIKELMIITKYLNDNSIPYDIDTNQNIIVLKKMSS